jgi:hypothetical protein
MSAHLSCLNFPRLVELQADTRRAASGAALLGPGCYCAWSGSLGLVAVAGMGRGSGVFGGAALA